MTTHILKCDPDIFDNIWEGKQTFELRQNDRGYLEGDEIISRETTNPGEDINQHGMRLDYTGRWIRSKVVGILKRNHFSHDRFDNWVIISIDILDKGVDDELDVFRK